MSMKFTEEDYHAFAKGVGVKLSHDAITPGDYYLAGHDSGIALHQCKSIVDGLVISLSPNDSPCNVLYCIKVVHS